MNPQVPNELISAYFDGEASPDERAAVESLLDESIATRRELDEIAQLSALLHSFPRESAPAELVANVQRQTDQMPLVVPATVVPVVPARSLRREWMAAVLGALVTAASLMLMANLTDRDGSHRTPIATDEGRRLGSSTTPAVAESVASAGGQPMLAMKSGVESDHDGVTAATVATPLPADAVTGPAVSTKRAEAASGAANFADNGSAPKGGPVAGDPFFEAQQFRNAGSNFIPLDNTVMLNNGTITLNNGDFLNSLKVGQVYQFVPQVADPENNVAVVDLEVLDIERGADQVQLFLSRQSIRPRRPGQMSERDKQSFEKLREQSKAGPSEIIAVYTYGPGDKLAKALEDMEQDPGFVSWSSQAPVQLPSGEELADRNSDKASVKDATVPTDQPIDGKSVAARRKEPVMDDNMDGEAELALDAVLARGTYSNSSLGGLSDSNTANGPQEQVGNAKQIGRGGGLPASRNRASDPVSKTQSAASRNAPSAATPAPAASPTTGAKTGPEADQKLDLAKKDLAQQSGYLRVVRQANDAPVSAETAPPLARSQGQYLDRGMNTSRRYTANPGLQQADVNNTNSRVDANQAVKVLFVLHPAQALTPAAAAPAGKPNP